MSSNTIHNKDLRSDIIGHQYGNYHQYYNFHPAEDRLKLLPLNFFYNQWIYCGQPSNYYLLDIGCNDGTLSDKLLKQVQSELQSYNVLCYLLGIDIDEDLINKANEQYAQTNSNIKFLALDILSLQSNNDLSSYLKSYNITHFNFISLFSITMWVHLNKGDEGLKTLLKHTSYLTNNTLLIEPQLWKCYKNASKRCRKLGISG